MVNASQAFHTAVKAGSPQRALLLFDDYIFTNDDIAASAGITYEEYMNPETDLTVGQCPSAAIEFTILNYEGLFETFTGGEFRAYLGVETNSAAYLHSGNCYAVDSQGAAFTGHDTAPYLREDGVDPGIDPGFPVKSIVIFDGVIYVLGENDQACALVRNGGSYLPAKLT
ncbi:MAG: hypothetical protein IKO02_05530, partial [Lentisphaeria bacterium]|nr:hypothetical protein [Lentisphaeria bacterium]